MHTFFPRLPIDNEIVGPPEALRKKDWTEEMHEKTKVMREDALRNQQETVKLQRRYYDEGARLEELKVGDLVRVYDPTAEGSKSVKIRNK